MPVATPDATILRLAQAKGVADSKKIMHDIVGDLSTIETGDDLVLVGIYIRSEMTAGGILRPMENVKEDVWQGKVGLILQMGPEAKGGSIDYGVDDWVGMDIKDTWAVRVRGLCCRQVPYERLRMRTKNPEDIF